MKLYYLFCSPEDESTLNDEGLEYLKSPQCEITPTFKAYAIGVKEDFVDAVYTASIHGGYLIITEEEYKKYVR